LSDGTFWRSQSTSSPWEKPWEIGSSIIKIGNSKCLGLINIEEICKEKLWIIKAEHYLDVEKLN
jgi:hypothetical protein